ncbi:Putative membrane-anchored protein [Candidatus Bealeia paramacronuclearis]|uniref:Membrane-anchored protein n=2 Tax=Candidatus Bealeia paramacronuclearis TaxID=1921001 RepID=A0ABZ2C434_9PROT|nr:putative membrane-anchored protein [Candidatus Bealeia paramacronuclearis]
MASISTRKIADVTLTFWIMKICATTVGETGGDMLSMTFKWGYATSTLILLNGFLVILAAQLFSKVFHPLLYWGVILATSTVGTTISDFMDRTLGLGYATGSTILIILLIGALASWRFSMGTISVDHIKSSKGECFYWLAILISNTLGTAIGDFLSDSSGLGYAETNLMISSIIGAIVLMYFFTSISRTTLFWSAFVLTRPFGATMGDLLTKNPEYGGFGFGTIGSSLLLLFILLGLIMFSSRQKHRAVE